MQMLFDGLKLMLAGTGMVFLFLGIMILWILLSSKLSARFQHLFPVETPGGVRTRGTSARTRPEDHQRLVAVVTAAIQRYRQEHPQD